MEDDEYLTNILSNIDENEYLSDLTTTKIREKKENIFSLYFESDDYEYLHDKLKDYIFVEDVKYIKYGKYIRWINITKDDLKLTTGGIVCSINVVKDGINIICKNNFNKMISIKLDDNLIFQKLSNQEKIILSVLDYQEM